jgi:hypothetical protein
MMRTEKEKMLAGELFHSMIPELTAERARCYAACQAFNGSIHSTPLVERINLFRKSAFLYILFFPFLYR